MRIWGKLAKKLGQNLHSFRIYSDPVLVKLNSEYSEPTEASSTTAANCTTVLHGFNGHKWSQKWARMAKNGQKSDGVNFHLPCAKKLFSGNLGNFHRQCAIKARFLITSE